MFYSEHFRNPSLHIFLRLSSVHFNILETEWFANAHKTDTTWNYISEAFIAAQWVMIPCDAEETGSDLFDSPVLNPEVTGWGQVICTPAALESGIAALLL